MPISDRVAGSAVCLSIFRVAVVLLAGIGTGSGAQTAPQLLPYTSKLIAGGGTTAIAAGATCPVSGFKSTDAYGDGCLAAEIQLVSPRFATADVNGNIFFSDYTNGLVRRVDAATGIVTAVAGGAATVPAAGTACGANLSTDALGDGCLGTSVKLGKPAGLVFTPAGDLYFADPYNYNVRKITATGGVILTSGVISLVAGNVAGTKGYAANNPTGNIVAATGSYLYSPYGLALDSGGDLYIAEEYKEAVLVVNLNATTTTTVTGVSIPPGTIAKIVGATTALAGSTTLNPVCPNSPATTNGCTYNTATFGIQANTSEIDSPYGVGVDGVGNVYFTGEYDNYIAKISTTGVLTQFAGIQSSPAKKLVRAAAGSFGIGSPFGVTSDASSNVYITDASSGVIWRVDGAGQSMYVVAGGAASTCSGATDTYGDGCPATQATLGHSGTGNFATTTSPGPGVFGVTVDAYSDLFFGDTETNLIREIASGTQFGPVGAGQPIDIVDIHFATGDTPSASPYSLTSGATNFSLGKATCTANSDNTTDCLLPVTATPSVLGPFTGTLTVKSTLGATGTFALSGIYVQSPVTRTAVSFAAGATACAGTTTYSTTTPITLTASLVANGPSAPTGTVTFFSNGTSIGTGTVVNIGTSTAPVYGATLTNTFSTVGTYTITATYSGDGYFKTSTGTSPTTLISSTPTFTGSLISSQQNTVSAGQTALYSFNVVQNVYTGTLTFACSGLPSSASCSFSPSNLVATGCSTTNTVALSILTQQGATYLPAAIGMGGTGLWRAMSLAGLGLALLLGIRRRRVRMRFGELWMVLALLLAASGAVGCGKVYQGGPATPSGSYTVTVTISGTAGSPSSFTVPLTVK